MINLSSIKKRKTLALSSITVSIITIAAIIAVFGAFTISSGAVSASSVTGAVFILDNAASGNNVTAYARGANGVLSSTGVSYPTGGTGTGSALASQGALALTSTGHWLLAVDAGSNQITVFKVLGASLAWASITGSQGTDPISLTVSNNLVYVLNAGSNNIAGFYLSNTGALTFIPGSNQPLSGQSSPSPEQIGFNPQGNILVVTEKGTNLIDTYSVNSAGVASAPFSQASAGSGPYGFAFTSKGILVVTEAATDTVSSYYVSNNGKLVTISGAIPTFGNAPCWLVISGNNRFAYTTNAHGGTISTFHITKSGVLVLQSSVAAHTAIPSLDMAFAQNSHFLYVSNGGMITGFHVYANGAISQITTVSGIPSSAAGLVAF